MTLSLSEEKVIHKIQQFQEVYSQPQNFSVKFDKVNWPTFQAILPVKIQFCFLQQEQLSSLKKQGSYREYVILGSLARQELLWWIENIRLSNGRKMQQQEPPIQTDASTKGWGAHCNGISTGGGVDGKK